MRKTLLVVAVLLWFAAVASFVFWFWPREYQVTVTHLAPERMVRVTTLDIRIGEQTGTVQIPIQHEVQKTVHETLTHTPTREEQLRFFSLAGVASLVFLYCAIVILSFGRCLWNGTAPAKSLELQLTGTVTFLMGIFGGALTLHSPAPSVDNQPTYSSPNYDAAPQPYYTPTPTYTPAPAPPLEPEERVGPP